jgi:hypothetical protein
MKSPAPAVCSDRECLNNVNGVTTLCCAACGKCGDHSHERCDEPETVHGRPDTGNPLPPVLS